MSNITNPTNIMGLDDEIVEQFKKVFSGFPQKTGVMVYCPTGEVSFHHINQYAGMQYAKDLLTEACDKVLLNFPVSCWRVSDIVSFGKYKGISAFMNLKCQYDDQWEFNDFAEELARNNRDPAVLSRLARLRGPLVLLIPNG